MFPSMLLTCPSQDNNCHTITLFDELIDSFLKPPSKADLSELYSVLNRSINIKNYDKTIIIRISYTQGTLIFSFVEGTMNNGETLH